MLAYKEATHQNIPIPFSMAPSSTLCEIDEQALYLPSHIQVSRKGLGAFWSTQETATNTIVLCNYQYSRNDTSTGYLCEEKRGATRWNLTAKSLFPDIRDFTKDEAVIYEMALSQLFKPTGRNLFKL